MILTNSEMQQIRKSIDAQAGMDKELLQRCGDLVHMGKFDEAVLRAFVLLEERLRTATGKEGMTGTSLANYAFNPLEGPLAKLLGKDPGEREGLRELYSGAFKLFRNPTAHGKVDYSPAQGKAIIGLVNLLLMMLKRAEKLPALGLLPDNVKTALGKIEKSIGPGAISRLSVFLGKCTSELGLQPSPAGHQRIPFKRYAFGKFGAQKRPKPHLMPVFYIESFDGPRPVIQFPIGHYACVNNFDVDKLIGELKKLEFQLVGKNQIPMVDLRTHNSQAFFNALFDLIVRTTDKLEESLPG